MLCHMLMLNGMVQPHGMKRHFKHTSAATNLIPAGIQPLKHKLKQCA